MTKDDVRDCRIVGCAHRDRDDGHCLYTGQLHCEHARGTLIEELDNFNSLLDDIKEAWRLIYEKSYPVR